MPHVIVPLDGSELAERALPFAARIGELTGSDVRLAQAVLATGPPEFATAIGMLLEAAEEYLCEQQAKLRLRYALPTTTSTAVGLAAELILAEAANPDATAVVMTTHGRTGFLRVVLGSVAERVVRRSPIPVYLVPAAAHQLPERPLIRNILVPLDGSALAYSVLGPATELAMRAGARLRLVRVFGEEEELTHAPSHDFFDAVDRQMTRLETKADEYFAPITAHLRDHGIAVDVEWSVGSPAVEIVAAADLRRADLIALATHGRSGIDRLRYGSVAEGVLRQASVPVMTFGPQALRRMASGVGPLAAEIPLPELVLVRELPARSHSM